MVVRANGVGICLDELGLKWLELAETTHTGALRLPDLPGERNLCGICKQCVLERSLGEREMENEGEDHGFVVAACIAEYLPAGTTMMPADEEVEGYVTKITVRRVRIRLPCRWCEREFPGGGGGCRRCCCYGCCRWHGGP